MSDRGRAERASGPVRTCIGCRGTYPASDLVRLVLTGGELLVGRDRPGRGAWLCAGALAACARLAGEQGGFQRAFRCSLPPSVVSGFLATVAPEQSGGDPPQGSGLG